MIKYITLLLAILSFNVSGNTCIEYNKLTPLQKGRLEFSYHQGEVYDKGYTLAAIALTESNAGVWRINLESKDIGLYQINSKTAYNTLGVTNHYKRLELVQKLIYDDILNAYIAISVLNYFEKYHKGNWRKMVSSYNAGFDIDKGKVYLGKIINNVNMLKKCMKIS